MTVRQTLYLKNRTLFFATTGFFLHYKWWHCENNKITPSFLNFQTARMSLTGTIQGPYRDLIGICVSGESNMNPGDTRISRLNGWLWWLQWFKWSGAGDNKLSLAARTAGGGVGGRYLRGTYLRIGNQAFRIIKPAKKGVQLVRDLQSAGRGLDLGNRLRFKAVGMTAFFYAK